MTAKSFASTEDSAEKKVSFDQIGAGLYAYTAEGDPNSGVIVGISNLPTPPFSGLWKFRGFVYENGAMHDIGTLGGTSSYLYDVNNSGTAVGCSILAMPNRYLPVYTGKGPGS